MRIITAIIITMIITCSANGNTYTYESEVDPAKFYQGEMLYRTPITADFFAAAIKCGDYPQYVICFLQLLSDDGTVMLMSYAYFNSENCLKLYSLTSSHYSERDISPGMQEFLIARLKEIEFHSK